MTLEETPFKKHLFPFGQIVATPNAVRAMMEAQINPAHLLARHVTGDWGTLAPEDWKANNHAVKNGLRILSSYQSPANIVLGVKAAHIWIITEADRSVTTFLLPEDY